MSAPLICNQTAYSKKSISNFRRKLYRKQHDDESQTNCTSSVPRQNRFIDQSILSNNYNNQSASAGFGRISINDHGKLNRTTVQGSRI